MLQQQMNEETPPKKEFNNEYGNSNLVSLTATNLVPNKSDNKFGDTSPQMYRVPKK